MMRSVLALASTTLAPLLLARSVHGPAPEREEPPLLRYYFDEAEPLQIDATRIALRLRAGEVSTALALLSQLGIAARSAEPWPIDGWWIVDLRRADTPAGIAAIVARAAADERVEFASPVFAGRDGGPVFVGPDLLVGFERALDDAAAEAILGKAGLRVLEREFAGMPATYRAAGPTKDGFLLLGAANDLARRADVVFAEPDWVFTGRAAFIPDDPGFRNCWGLHNTGQSGGSPDMDMDAPEAWDFTVGDASIVVVVLDTGVQQDHPDIHQVAGADFTSDGGDGGPVNDCDKHGTAVAGCVSATINNGIGTVGVAPGCVIASARTFISESACDGFWTSQASWTASALDWAHAIGARVTNNSNGYGFTSSAIAQKYADTRAAGIVHFASAGNDSDPEIGYPASLPAVNAVASLNNRGERASSSNYGIGLAFSAPGVSIYTTDRTGAAGYSGGDYGYRNGTSFASPYAAGVAALVLSRRPELDAIQTEEALQRSCVDLGPPGYDTGFGWGFVNALGALRTLDSACRVLVLADGDALTALRFPGREPLWSLAFAELARRPWIVPTAGGAVVLVSAGGATFGIDLATGEILWSRAGECSVSDSLRDTYGQLYTDEVAFPYGPPRLSAGGAPSVLLVDAAAGGTTTVLLDTRTGADIWSRTEQSGSHGSAFIPRSDGSYDVTFRALSTGEMMRIDGRTGEAIVWARSLPHYIGVPIPDVTNDGEYDLFARADATDEMLWLDGAAGGTRFSMAFGAFGVVGVQAIRNASNSVHVLAAAQSSAGGGIRRIRINGGGSLWECSSAYNDQTLRGTIRRVDGRVTVLSGRRHAGTAVAIDADTGAALWDHVPTNDPDAFPMGAGLDATGDGNEDVLSRGADGLLRVYDGLTGGLDAGFPPLAASGGAATTIVDLPPACAADVNADGAVDTRDVVEFLNAWAAGDSRADFTGDGAVDSRDVIAFLNAWSAGCP